MRILHTVEHYPPFSGGMAEVVKQLSEALVKKGHEVVVATSYHKERKDRNMNGVQIEAFQIEGNAVRGIRGEYKRYQAFILENKFDAITNFAAQQWATDLMLPLLNQVQAKKIFVPTGFSALYVPAYQEYFAFLAEVMQQYDMNIFLSETYRDIEFAKGAGIDKLSVIPNGAAAAEFLKVYNADIRSLLEISQNEFIILHVGSHTGLKGHLEAIEIFHRADVEKAVLIIVGDAVNEKCITMCQEMAARFNLMPERNHDSKRVIITELSRENTVLLYQAADLFLFPSNIECSPIVLFECMASRTPFLTTDVGNTEEIITWSGAGKILPTEKDQMGYSHAKLDESAVMLSELYRNAALRNEMSESGFLAWKKHFTWEGIAEKYEQVYLGDEKIPSKKAHADLSVRDRCAAVSVIIPTYNRAATIENSILSALRQSYPVLEVLVCDDGSTDNSELVVKQIGDHRIVWLSGQHMGRPAGPRNRGIRAAKGEWLAFLDSDDEWNKEKTARQFHCLKQYNARAVCSNGYRLLPQQGIVGCLLNRPQGLIGFHELSKENVVICSSAMIHRSLVDIVEGFPEDENLKALEDYALWLRLGTQTEFAFIDTPLIVYRDTPSTSIRSQNTNNVWEQKKYVFGNLMQWMKPEHVKKNDVEIALEIYKQSLINLFR